MSNTKRKSGLTGTQTAQVPTGTQFKSSLAEIVKAVTVIIAFALGAIFLLTAGGLVDGTGTSGQITKSLVLAGMNFAGGLLAVRLEKKNEINN